MTNITGKLELETGINGEKYVFSKEKNGIYVALVEGGRDRCQLLIPDCAVRDFVETLNKLDDF